MALALFRTKHLVVPGLSQSVRLAVVASMKAWATRVQLLSRGVWPGWRPADKARLGAHQDFSTRDPHRAVNTREGALERNVRVGRLRWTMLKGLRQQL